MKYFYMARHYFSSVSKTECLIPKKEALRFIKECFQKVGTPEDYSEMVSHHLVEADIRSHLSHGLSRLKNYIDEIELQLCNPKGIPTIVKENSCTALVDGQNSLGVVVGHFSMRTAIKKAQNMGIGWVCAQHSNHFGICQYYVDMALKEGLIGFACTNTSPLVTPTRSQKPTFGTNPLSLGAPALHGDQFLLDMSTSTVAVGKIEIQRRKKEKLPTKSWALGSNGQPTLDADEAYLNGKGLLPLGGLEINSSYKGYGLGMMVEIFCGILSGSQYGPNIRNWLIADRVANLGHCFFALDPSCFAPGSAERLQDLMDYCRGLEPVDPYFPVLVPGDKEKQAKKSIARNGDNIMYTPSHIECYEALAQKLGVPPMKPFIPS